MDVTTASAGNAGGESTSTALTNTEGNNTDTIQTGEGTAAKAAAAAARKEKFQYKIDGEDVEEEIDLSDIEGLKKRMQLSYAADKRMGEARTVKQKAMEIVKAFEEDPTNLFRKLGPKGRQVAEQFLLEQINEEMLTPEQKKDRDDKSELQKLRDEKKKREEEDQNKQISAKEKEYASEYQTTIIGALEKCGLPKSPRLVADVARLMSKKLEHGIELDATDLAKLIREERGNDQKSIVKDMSGEQLIEYFGEDVAKKIRLADLKKLKEKQGQIFQNGNTEKQPAPKQTDKGYETLEEWKERIRRQNSGG